MDIREKLKSNSLRNELYHHSIFNLDAASPEDAACLLGQYWYPLHYFPTFIGRVVASAPSLAAKTAISTILHEELGEGNIDRAHEKVYVDSLTPLGFSEEQLTQSKPFPETEALVAVYSDTENSFLPALGSLYATESTDLAIVSGIGKLIRLATGSKDPIEWIDIHVAQEPNHVAQTDLTVLALSPEEEAEVISRAEDMWRAWIKFFSAVEAKIPAAV
ncbi:MAG: iron-containing redox enzyme family protein [Acidobacteriota bacterium]|nr:iron-containing redox enzyme family protein [Acidobacteriota bacterium]